MISNAERIARGAEMNGHMLVARGIRLTPKAHAYLRDLDRARGVWPQVYLDLAEQVAAHEPLASTGRQPCPVCAGGTLGSSPCGTCGR